MLPYIKSSTIGPKVTAPQRVVGLGLMVVLVFVGTGLYFGYGLGAFKQRLTTAEIKALAKELSSPVLYSRNVERIVVHAGVSVGSVALEWLRLVDDPCNFFELLSKIPSIELPEDTHDRGWTPWYVVFKKDGKAILCGKVPPNSQNSKAHALIETAINTETTRDFAPVIICCNDRPHPIECPSAKFVARQSLFAFAHFAVPQNLPRTFSVPSFIFHDQPFRYSLGQKATATYDEVCEEIQTSGLEKHPVDKLVWRGNAQNHPMRQKLLKLSKQVPEAPYN